MRPAAQREGSAVAVGAAVLVGLAASGIATWLEPFGATVGGGDLFAMYLSKHAYIADTYLSGRLPLWNPYEFAGLPLHGTSQGSALYAPVVVPNLFLGRVAALQVAYWLHIVGFAVGMVLYLREHRVGLAASCSAAFLAIVWFFESANGAATNQAHYTFEVAWLPWILLCWTRFCRGDRRAAVALPVLVCLQWLPGYPEFPMDTAVLLGLVALAGPGPPLARRVAWVVGLVALGTVIASLQLVPLAESTGESIRIAWADAGFDPILERFSLHWHDLDQRTLGLFGAAGVIWILVGLERGGRERRAWGIAFAFAFLATTWPLSLMYEVYPYKLFRFAWGWRHLAPVFAACLVALGIDAVLRGREQEDPRPWGPTAIAGGVAAFAVAYGNLAAAGVALVCAAVLAPPLVARRAAVVAVLLALIPAVVGFHDITARRAQRAPDLGAQVGRAALLTRLRETLPGEPRVFGETELRAGSFLPDRLPSPLGHEAAVPPRRMARLVRRVGMWKVFGHPRDPGELWRGMAGHPNVMAAIGLGIVTGTPREVRPLLAAGYREVGRFEDGGVAVFREPIPRLSIHHHAVIGRDEDETFALVTDPGFDPFRQVVLEADALPEGLAPGAAVGHASRPGESVEWKHDAPERIVVTAELRAPGVVLLRDAQYPGWTVRVDGEPARSWTANHAFRAVVLPAGRHEIEWRYRPFSVVAGAAGSGLGLLALLGLARWLRRPGSEPWGRDVGA